MRRAGMVSLSALLFSFFLATAVHSQKASSLKVAPTTGTLMGEVNDQHGTPLAGTVVTVTNIAKQLSQDATTDAQGVFRVDALVPGDYELSYNAKDFAVLKEKTKIKLGKMTKVHVHLKYIAPAS
jgi:protocatechuate 3,4-dioxygenase beta subunit